MSTWGWLPGTGIGTAIAGRVMPRMRPMRSSAAAIVAPVLPAEIIALASPSRTASAARTTVESFLRRTACGGLVVHPDDLGRLDQFAGRPSRRVRPARPAGPTTTTGIPPRPDVRRRRGSGPGAASPPMASTATGSIAVGSADVDDDAVAVPAARTTHRVRGLCVATARAEAARPAVAASRRWHDGCGSSTSMSSSSERPSFALPRW